MRTTSFNLDTGIPEWNPATPAPYYEDEFKANQAEWKKVREESGPVRFDAPGGNKPWNRTWTYEDLSVRQQREGWSVRDHIVHGPEGQPRCSAAIKPSVKAGKPKPCCNWPWEASPERPKGINGRCRKHGGNPARGGVHHETQKRVSEAKAWVIPDTAGEINGFIESWGVAVMDGNVVKADQVQGTVAQRQRRYRVPASLVEAYNAQIEIEDYLSNKDEIAIIGGRIQALFDTIRDGGNPETWKSLNQTAIAALRAKREGNEKEYNDAISTMFILIAEGDNENKAYERIFESMEALRKQRDTEIKRITAAQNSVQKDDVLQLFRWYQETVIAESDAITDPDERKAFLSRIQRAVDTKMAGGK